VHYKRKSYSLAIPQFEMALNGRPDDPVISLHLALALSGNDKIERAIEILEKLLENNEAFSDEQKAADLLAKLKKEQSLL
jgi:thioredoxin-like negative regulator of GroEL